MGNYDYTKIKTGDYNYDYDYTKFGKADYDYNNHCNRLQMIQWRIQGGGSRGSGPPPFGPRCRLFNIGPKVGPPLL